MFWRNLSNAMNAIAIQERTPLRPFVIRAGEEVVLCLCARCAGPRRKPTYSTASQHENLIKHSVYPLRYITHRVIAPQHWYTLYS